MLMEQGKDIQEDVDLLLKQKEQAEQELARIRSERKTDELRNTAAKTATTVLKGVNSLLSSNKISRLEAENNRLQAALGTKDEQIEQLQRDMQKQQTPIGQWLNQQLEKRRMQREERQQTRKLGFHL